MIAQLSSALPHFISIRTSIKIHEKPAWHHTTPRQNLGQVLQFILVRVQASFCHIYLFTLHFDTSTLLNVLQHFIKAEVCPKMQEEVVGAFNKERALVGAFSMIVDVVDNLLYFLSRCCIVVV